MKKNEFIPDYMKTKDFAVIVVLVLLVNGILYFFDKEPNGPGEMFSSSIRSNAIVILVVGIIYMLWRKGIAADLWRKMRKK